MGSGYPIEGIKRHSSVSEANIRANYERAPN